MGQDLKGHASPVPYNAFHLHTLNARGMPNVSAFRLGVDGTLTAIPNSTRNLPGGSAAVPADVRFRRDGTLLLVTETGTHGAVPTSTEL